MGIHEGWPGETSTSNEWPGRNCFVHKVEVEENFSLTCSTANTATIQKVTQAAQLGMVDTCTGNSR